MGLHSFVHRIFRGNVHFVQVLIYFCAGLYIISLLIDPSAIFAQRGGFLNFLSPGPQSLLVMGMTGAPLMAAGRWWTLITAIFLHGGILHILFNMLWIRQLAPMVENLYGISRLILIFLVSGVFGFILSSAMGIQFTIGASGSIFGLLGALIYYGRSRGGVFREIIYPQLMTWAVVLFLFGLIVPGIDNFAHFGGFVGGYLIANIMSYQERKPETVNHRRFAGLAVILVVLAFMLQIISVI